MTIQEEASSENALIEKRAHELTETLDEICGRLGALSLAVSAIGSTIGIMDPKAGEGLIENLLDMAGDADQKGFAATARELNNIVSDLTGSRLCI